MARFDLLDEYTCVVVPKRSQSGARGEMARHKSSLNNRPAKASWRHAVALILGLGIHLTMVAAL